MLVAMDQRERGLTTRFRQDPAADIHRHIGFGPAATHGLLHLDVKTDHKKQFLWASEQILVISG